MMTTKTQQTIERLVETLKAQYPFRYITLRSAERSEDGAHKQPLHRWGDSQYQYDTYEKATQGGRRGVGLVIPKGILVVDVDAKTNTPEVLNRWKDYAVQHRVPIGRTATGGWHLMFRCDPSQFRGVVQQDLGDWGIVDLRTEGNYIAITHPLYKWYLPPEWSGGLPQVPDIIQQIQWTESTTKAVVHKFLSGEVVEDGGRNQALTLMALFSMGLYEALTGEVMDDEMFDEVRDWLNDHFVDEPEEKFAQDRSLYDRLLRYNKDGVKHYALSMLRKNATNPRLKTLLSVMGLQSEAEQKFGAVATTNGKSHHPITEKDTVYEVQWWKGDLYERTPRLRWVVDGLMALGDLVLVAAPPKAGKTTLIHELGFSIATGNPFYGMPTNKCQVAYWFNDETPEGEGERVRLYAERFGIDFRTYPYLLYAFHPVFPFGKFLEFVRKTLHHSVLFIDVVGRFMEEVNDYGYVQRFLSELKQVAVENQLCIICVHHASKNEPRNPIGSTAFTGGFDQMIFLQKDDEGYVHVSMDGRRPKRGRFTLRFNEQGFLVMDDMRPNLGRYMTTLKRIFSHSNYIFADKLDKDEADVLLKLHRKGLVQMKTNKEGDIYFRIPSDVHHLLQRLKAEVEEMERFAERIGDATDWTVYQTVSSLPSDTISDPSTTQPTQPTPIDGGGAVSEAGASEHDDDPDPTTPPPSSFDAYEYDWLDELDDGVLHTSYPSSDEGSGVLHTSYPLTPEGDEGLLTFTSSPLPDDTDIDEFAALLEQWAEEDLAQNTEQGGDTMVAAPAPPKTPTKPPKKPKYGGGEGDEDEESAQGGDDYFTLQGKGADPIVPEEDSLDEQQRLMNELVALYDRIRQLQEQPTKVQPVRTDLSSAPSFPYPDSPPDGLPLWEDLFEQVAKTGQPLGYGWSKCPPELYKWFVMNYPVIFLYNAHYDGCFRMAEAIIRKRQVHLPPKTIEMAKKWADAKRVVIRSPMWRKVQNKKTEFDLTNLPYQQRLAAILLSLLSAQEAYQRLMEKYGSAPKLQDLYKGWFAYVQEVEE
jgi:hypothetical protein